jgi:hypothetical protein
MIGRHLYETSGWMSNAYEHRLATRWQQERERSRGAERTP